jgi:hypothetical protein
VWTQRLPPLPVVDLWSVIVTIIEGSAAPKQKSSTLPPPQALLATPPLHTHWPFLPRPGRFSLIVIVALAAMQFGFLLVGVCLAGIMFGVMCTVPQASLTAAGESTWPVLPSSIHVPSVDTYNGDNTALVPIACYRE